MSEGGVIAYQSFVGGELSELHWIDRSGKSLGVLGEPAVYASVALSPDDTRVVASVPDNVMGDLWLVDLARGGPPVRLTRTPESEDVAAWSPQGDRIAYVAGSPAENRLFFRAPNPAARSLERLSGRGLSIFDWSPDGHVVLGAFGDARLALLDVDGGGEPASLNLPSGAGYAQFSPDGRWIAYQSRESGQSEVYIMPMPDRSGQKVALSVQGGWPRWSADGKELFFLSGGNFDLMAVDVRVQSDTLSVGVPRRLLQTRLKTVVVGWPYDVARDGRFLMNLRIDAEIAPPAMVVANWQALIQRN